MSEILFLEYPKCTTCQKARKWLEENGVRFKARHIVEDRPDADELKTWLAQSGKPLKSFFNTSGLKYKALGLKDKLPQLCLLYTSPSPRDRQKSRMPSSA